MPKIKYRTIHLIVLMTIIAVSFPAYTAFEKYQHKQRVARLETLTKEINERMNEFLSLAKTSGRPQEGLDLKQLQLQLTEQQQHIKSLELEASELAVGLAQEEVRARN